MVIEITPEVVGEEEYYTVSQMAALTNRSDQCIYKLVKMGNSVRKMFCLKIVGRVLIPVSELTQFPFTPVGVKSNSKIYHYDEEGVIIEPTENNARS